MATISLGFFETFFQIAQRVEAMAFVFANPALADLVQRQWIEVMQFLAAVPDGGDEVGRFQQAQVLGDGLPRHVQVLHSAPSVWPLSARSRSSNCRRLASAKALNTASITRIICNLMVACQAGI